MPHYRNLFFDLDDTLWAFSENACDTLEEVYREFHYGRFFSSFDQFYALYTERNRQLWTEYAAGKITKPELNRLRFLYPLECVGAGDAALARRFEEEFFRIIPCKARTMPHAHEVLQALAPHYNLYILSNGFRELQCRKMKAAGLDVYFKKVILSEDIGVLKPHAAIFHFALSATQSQVNDSLMIGDSWENDITGAAGIGMHQVFYDPEGGTAPLPFRPTYRISDLQELTGLLGAAARVTP